MHRRGQGPGRNGAPRAGAALWARSEQPLQGREVPNVQQGHRVPCREGDGGKQLTGGLSRSRGWRGAIAPIFICWGLPPRLPVFARQWLSDVALASRAWEDRGLPRASPPQEGILPQPRGAPWAELGPGPDRSLLCYPFIIRPISLPPTISNR